jgi:RNA polymerase sigma factor (sigma-70 family)
MASAVPELPVLARDQAFETLYRRYVKDVYHYALALLRNPADAEDVTQTTFLNAYRAYKRGDEILKPQNWLIKIAHNVARTRYARASRRVKEVPLDEHVAQLAVPEEDAPNIEGVLRALGRLPFNQRAALVMRELEGRSYAEIADTLDVSVSAVETLIFRARKSLRMRASALRVLTAVPLPGSLAGLFEGSAVVAGGGGAVVGAGFLAKAAIALIVGAVATGLARENLRQASAAPEPSRLAVAPASVGGKGTTVRQTGWVRSQHATGAKNDTGLRSVIMGSPLTAHPAVAGAVAGAQGTLSLSPATPVSAAIAGAPVSVTNAVTTTAAAVTTTATTATTTAATATTTVTKAATDLVGTVEHVAAAVSAALPVQLPAVPTKLPAVPTVPVPALPVQPPPLPIPTGLP